MHGDTQIRSGSVQATEANDGSPLACVTKPIARSQVKSAAGSVRI